MKVSTSVIALTALSSNAKALEFTFDAPCCYDNVSAGAEAVGKDINDILDTRNEDRARRIVEQLCASADRK